MSESAIVVPKAITLPLTINGWTITVREELNHGEHVAMLARMYRETESGKLRVDPLTHGDALMIAYLVDWTLTDQRGERLEIRGLPPDGVQDVLNNLRVPVCAAVKAAVEVHEQTVRARDAELKKTAAGETPSPETSLSVG